MPLTDIMGVNCYRSAPALWSDDTPLDIDRQYLRLTAVYRCLSRYGWRRVDALPRLTEVIEEWRANYLLNIWMRSMHFEDHPDAMDRNAD